MWAMDERVSGGGSGHREVFPSWCQFPRNTRAPRGIGREKQTEPPLPVLKRLLEEGALTPVVDRTYPLDAVADAVRHLESGRFCGKILITM
jgi:NADPH:quinone reductase-like Zn-dependent oxidoreductase